MILTAKIANQVITSRRERLREIANAEIPNTTKLYGQIIPKTQSGGCHDGRRSERYQAELLLTQIPAPIA
jgi:hypothetical protein